MYGPFRWLNWMPPGMITPRDCGRMGRWRAWAIQDTAIMRPARKGKPEMCARQEGFSGDRLEGEVTYTTLNQEGETSTWMLEVKDGTVQLDDRWIYIEERGEYQLMSQEDDSHAYIMDEQLADQPVWINLLAWEE